MKPARLLLMALLLTLLASLGSGCASLTPSASREPTWQQDYHQNDFSKTDVEKSDVAGQNDFIQFVGTTLYYAGAIASAVCGEPYFPGNDQSN